MLDFRRTHTCGELRKENIKESVKLSGWVHRRRDHGGLIFIDLRDRFGLTQLVFDPVKNPSAHAIAEKLRSEWVITAHGRVIPRAEGMTNPKMATGEIEVEIENIEILSKAKTPPFSICDENIDVNEELRLQYRYLDMRRGDILKRLIMRHKAMLATRAYFDKKGFVEVSTPIMAKSTPEGARDYLVPSRIYPGMFYALPQSPQIFKQILMVGGLDRYFQIAQCFRDEDLRADRQPEFTQIDIEMSFGTIEELFPLIEDLMIHMFKECIGVTIKAPFRRVTYQYCIENYGTDKPDLRFGMPLIRLDDIAKASTFTVFNEQLSSGGIVKGICVKGGADISRKAIDDYTQFVGRLGVKGLAWIKCQPDGTLSSSITKFFSEDLQKLLKERMECEPNDIIFMIADIPARTHQALDHLRRRIAKDRNLIDPNRYEFLWVTDFPLFTWNPDEKRLESEHHPFTSPHFDDMELLEKDPLKARALGYDLVLNGYETASGSQRIHNSELQQKMFEILKLTPEQLKNRFGFFIEALSYGTPPHLGAALGFDRLIMILTQTDNIKDVIAYPKTQKASDLMMECPSSVDQQQLKDLGINIS
jgi:aspartyl-tRNA synthetase